MKETYILKSYGDVVGDDGGGDHTWIIVRPTTE